MEATLILSVGSFVFLLIAYGAFLAFKDAVSGSIRPFDYFFLSAVVLSFALANYLWFVANNPKIGTLVSVWVAGNIALALYFRSLFTRSTPNNN
ncbi:MAG: hypothetical protein SFU91_01715 [Chloroherpetonaceae bacterium]|nr:hypothetical protein [Chloroherpetonaceae bacterium]